MTQNSSAILGESSHDQSACEMHFTPPGPERLTLASSPTHSEGTRTRKKSLYCILSAIVGVLWLAPMIYLLYLNLSNNVIGAAAWCPGKACRIMSYYIGSNVTTNSLIGQYDKQNRDLLGGLQFAAKALEVWFVYVATSLVYLVACELGKQAGCLPLGYILTYMEYGDLRMLANPTLYNAPRLAHGQTISQNRTHTALLYLFAILILGMCVLTNLMGPSVAVLMIPTLQWRETPKVVVEQFSQLSADGPPTGNAIPGCNADELSQKNYSCLQAHHGSDLDALVISNIVVSNKLTDEEKSTGDTFWLLNSPVTFEGAMPFAFNMSISPASPSRNDTSFTMWALSRQVLRSLSKDFEGLYQVMLGRVTANRTYTERYQPYNDSYSLVLQRQGPMIGMEMILSASQLSTTTIDANRNVSCYFNFFSPTDAKCFRTGQGWNATNSIESFTIPLDEADPDPMNVRFYWSDRSTLVDVDSLGPCFRNGTAPDPSHCDYDALFANGKKVFQEPRTGDVFVMEVSPPRSWDNSTVFVAEFFFSYGFATYTLDATTIYPSLPLVQVPNPPDPTEALPTVFDPAWAVAAWGLGPDRNATLSQAVAFQLRRSALSILADWDNTLEQFNFIGIVQYTMLQAASLVTFSSTEIDPRKPPSPDDRQPALWTNVRRQVWGWSVQDGASVLGVVVGLLGVLTVVARTMLLLVTQEREPSSTELLAAALRYKYEGDFEGVEGGAGVARVRYRVLGETGLDRRFQAVQST